MKVRVDRQVCTGHARCHVNAPDVYELDELGYNQLDGEMEVGDALVAQARRGADSCPERAITIVSDPGL
ncbi:MAG TPA: ferredoxin [Acidimicrobiales bacterium]|nr:ferredoxin [Acidimicrobiales bacterium]